MPIKEDFQRAIAQSQIGKSLGGGIKGRKNFREFTGTAEELEALLKGKTIQFIAMRGKEEFYNSGKQVVTKVEEGVAQALYGDWPPHFLIYYKKPSSTVKGMMPIFKADVTELLQIGEVTYIDPDDNELVKVELK